MGMPKFRHTVEHRDRSDVGRQGGNAFLLQSTDIGSFELDRLRAATANLQAAGLEPSAGTGWLYFQTLLRIASGPGAFRGFCLRQKCSSSGKVGTASGHG